ncbi:hypothetical protein BJX66DRAFT_49084 [Aspergillus keveii]|uniref:Uncharacterized protein n=1 Tax=Aspergillus keveii TaxID=714993 RepID=A0ABR4FRG9_9EURO
MPQSKLILVSASPGICNWILDLFVCVTVTEAAVSVWGGFRDEAAGEAEAHFPRERQTGSIQFVAFEILIRTFDDRAWCDRSSGKLSASFPRNPHPFPTFKADLGSPLACKGPSPGPMAITDHSYLFARR